MLQMEGKQVKIIAVLGAIIIGLVSFIALGGKTPGPGTDPEDGIVAEDIVRTNGSEGDVGDIDNDNGKDPEQEDSHRDQPIKIYMAGQVQNPGVIEVPEGCRLNEAVEMAGGFLAEADLLRVNLAIKVQDEGMYYIPKIGEEETPEVASPMVGGGESSDKVNINTADQSLLETLPRIGPVTAQNIISYREENGPFKDIEDIKNVSRIGEKTFEGLKDFITVR